MRDPADPMRLRADLDNDGLHPSIAGYEAMAEAVPLSLFAERPSADRQGKQEGPALAVTFDDIPIHGPLPEGQTRLDVVRSIASTLREAGVPEAYGFVNAAGIESEPELGATLDVWRSVGYPLGNHGWSHLDLNRTDTGVYLAEITRNEEILADAMGEADWRWYRYPNLAEGDDAEKRLAVRAFLKERGYRIAGVTMSFHDYLWNEPYARCLAAGDEAGVAALERSYLEAARESIAYDRDAARRLYGRDIPYVLLMHVGAFDARMLPELLALYREEGFRFVTLAEASGDPAYAADVDPAAPPLPVGLGARLAAAGVELPAPRSYGEMLDQLCR
jgi:peptidoglycan/xylan/chitin deacetylase (PgdA/CDA1 family)